jgi:GTP-binding protein EngB required for normal cell division
MSRALLRIRRLAVATVPPPPRQLGLPSNPRARHRHRHPLGGQQQPWRQASSASPASPPEPLKPSAASQAASPAESRRQAPVSSPVSTLTPAQELSVAAHRNAVRTLLAAVAEVDRASDADLSLLRSQLDRLDDGLFLLVVVGEYNSGKSTCVNALLGRRVVAEGVIPTTAEVTVLRYATDPSSPPPPPATPQGVVVLSQNVEMLKTVTLVDSPGTNAIDRRHEALTKEYLPLCDFVLFVTSADRPFSESERVFLKSIRAWGKKCILLINKADLLADADAKREVVQFVTSSSRALLGGSPKVFTISSRQAFEAKASATGASGPHWDASGFEPLEEYLSQRLDAGERLRIKLDSVASVASTVGTLHLHRLAAESAVIDADAAALSQVAALAARCESTVERGFPAHFSRVDNVLLELVERADVFFDAHVSINNMAMLVKKDAVSRAFIDEVVQGTERDVERQARGLAEWVSDKLARNIADVASIFSRRVGERKADALAAAPRHERQQSILSDAESGRLQFMSTSADADTSSTNQLMSDLGEAAARLGSTYKPEAEGLRVADALSSSVRTAIAMEVGALGILGAALSVSALDVTSVASTGVLATGGLLVLPRRRRALRAELRARVASLRTRLERDLSRRVKEQLVRHTERVRAAVDPFSTHTSSRAAAIAAQSRSVTHALDGLTAVRRVAEAAAAASAASAATRVTESAKTDGMARN